MSPNKGLKGQVQKIAIDIGYGDVKVATEAGVFKFPSAVARANEVYSALNGGEEETYEFNGRKWRVGEHAIHNAVSTRGFKFLIKFSPLLIYVAIKKAGLDITKPIELSTGLSIIDWEDGIEEFENTIRNIHVNGEAIVLRDLLTCAQGQGVLKDDNAEVEPLVCVVDIGYNTLDYLVFVNGKASQQESDATKDGAHKMITRIQSLVSKEYNITVSEQYAKEIFLKKGLIVGGEFIDLKLQIEIEQEDYSENIISSLENNFATFTRANRIIFSGGGAYYIDHKALPKSAIFSEPSFEFANVRGYLKMLG
jgi:plasmid segregation protein ParM